MTGRRDQILSNVSDDFSGNELREILAGPYLVSLIECDLPPYAMIIPLKFIPVLNATNTAHHAPPTVSVREAPGVAPTASGVVS